MQIRNSSPLVQQSAKFISKQLLKTNVWILIIRFVSLDKAFCTFHVIVKFIKIVNVDKITNDF